MNIILIVNILTLIFPFEGFTDVSYTRIIENWRRPHENLCIVDGQR